MDWIVHDNQLVRTFAFPDFASALAFVNRVGAAAEEANHHPDVKLSWGKVTLAWSTHDTGDISALDRKLAQKCDELYTAVGVGGR
jgi:4a-hydroxytetrahydrobiopterin dehydratase